MTNMTTLPRMSCRVVCGARMRTSSPRCNWRSAPGSKAVMNICALQICHCWGSRALFLSLQWEDLQTGVLGEGAASHFTLPNQNYGRPPLPCCHEDTHLEWHLLDIPLSLKLRQVHSSHYPSKTQELIWHSFSLVVALGMKLFALWLVLHLWREQSVS